MKKTVVCHFYNEEFLLPWWCKHHYHVFDHGIMIDYASTDRSVEIIRELCPTWEIRPSRNEFFDSGPIDQEVMDIESELEGWRMALNVTEFLYGNLDHLDDRKDPTQYFIGNYTFVDMADHTKGTRDLRHDVPLYEQRRWGYNDLTGNGIRMAAGSMPRMNRSLHNYPVKYDGGRHWPETKRSFDDLVLFYYGWVSLTDAGLERKAQIRSKISEKTPTVHDYTKQQFAEMYRIDQQPRSQDLMAEIRPILDHSIRCTGQYF